MAVAVADPAGFGDGLGDGLALLEAAVDAFDAAAASWLSDDELASAMVRLETLQARLDAQRVRLTGAFDTRGGWRADAAKSAAAWLAHATRAPKRECAARVRLGRSLHAMPATAAAFAAGQISHAHAQRLAAANRPEVAEAFARDEPDLVGYARTLSHARFLKAIAYWEQCADPDGAEDHIRPGHLQISQTLGGHHLDGFLPAVDGAEVAEAVRRIAAELFAADWADAQARFAAEGRDPDTVTAADLARTDHQRNADALVQLCRQAHAAPPGSKPPRPLVTVVVDQHTATGRVCEILGGQPVTPGQAAAALCRGDLAKIIYEHPTKPILASDTRLFTGLMRRAIQIRSGSCDVPGCDTPAHHCEIDHITPHAHGGATSCDNGCCLCPFHHRLKTAGRLHAIRGPDAQLTFRFDGKQLE